MRTTVAMTAMLVGAAAAAHAMPVQLDSRTVTENGMAAQLVRYQDTMAACPVYGVLHVIDRKGQLLDEKTICGATNLLAAVQGTQVVFYVYAQNNGGLDLYRYVTERREMTSYPFHANGLKITSLGYDVMVQAYYPQQTQEGIIQRRDGWVWRYKSPAPKPIK